jgi:predicted metal-dependent hydrolase
VRTNASAGQLALPFVDPLAAQPPTTHDLRQEPASTPVVFVRHVRARRYVLRVRPDGTARVTIPRGGSRREAERFLGQNLGWLARERGRLRALRETSALALAPGQTIWFRGERCRIAVLPTDEAYEVVVGDLAFDHPRAWGDMRPALEVQFRQLAARELPERVHDLAAQSRLHHRVTRIVVRNQRSRWGSCSTSGTISLNWRLVQMPPAVRDYVIHHELMHLLQANHSRRFWRLVYQACPWYREAQLWLRRNGRDLL